MTTLIPKYDQGATDAVNRPFNLKLNESVSVMDFIPVGTNTNNTDCSAYFQKAINTGKSVFVPVGVYQLNSAITMLPSTLSNSSNTVIYGENYETTILVKVGGGNIFEVGDFGRIDISGLWFTGAGATAIKLASGYSAYIFRPVINNCQFGLNLYRGIDGNFIFATISNCSFGVAYGGSSTTAGATWLYGNVAGGYYENMNIVNQCTFGNCPGIAINLSGGGQWEINFADCENNYQDIKTNDIQQLTLNNYYAEIGTNPTYQTLFNSTDNGLVIINRASISNQLGGAGASMIGYGGTIRVQILNSDIATNTGQYVAYNNNDGSHAFPASPVSLEMLSNRIQGNTSDPLYYWGAVQNQSVVVKSWVVFNGTTGALIKSSYQGVSITKNGTGDYVITFPVAITQIQANMCAVVTSSGTNATASITGAAPNYISVQTYALGTATPADDARISVMVVAT